MKAQLFFENSEYNYLKRFTKHDMMQFAEKYLKHKQEESNQQKKPQQP